MADLVWMGREEEHPDGLLVYLYLRHPSGGYAHVYKTWQKRVGLAIAEPMGRPDAKGRAPWLVHPKRRYFTTLAAAKAEAERIVGGWAWDSQARTWASHPERLILSVLPIGD